MHTEQRKASIKLLQVIWVTDYRNSWHPSGVLATEYVYFDPVLCKFYFSSEQIRGSRKAVRQLVKRYDVHKPYDAVKIVATKYPFSKIVLGAIVYHKLMTYREFFTLVRDKPEWF